MSVLSFSTDLRNARAQAIIDKLDAGPDPGVFKFYTAPKPAAGAAITTQTLIGTCTLSKPCGTISEGVLTFDTISDDSAADADGDIAWCRAFDSTGAFVIDMLVGNEASSAPIRFNTVTARVGGVLQILSGQIAEGNT